MGKDEVTLPARFDLPDVPRAQAEALLAPHRLAFGAGEDVHCEGERSPVTYLVISGWVAVSKALPDGERQILDLLLPGDFFDPRAANQETSTIALETLTEAVLVALPEALTQRLNAALPGFEELKSQSLAAALTRMLERMLRLGKAPARARIAHVLIELWTRLCALDPDNGRALHLPLTQQKMGEVAGLTSVHVSRVLSQLSEQGLIETNTAMGIRLLDLDGLAAVAGTDPDIFEDEIIPQSPPDGH